MGTLVPMEPSLKYHPWFVRILTSSRESGRGTVLCGQFDWGGRLLKGNGGVYQGWLSVDGNDRDRAKPQASFTARPTIRAVAKAELSEPTIAHRSVEDQRIKVTPGITG